MDITVENVLKAIKDINDRRANNFAIIAVQQNSPIGVDSLSFFMNASAESLEHTLGQMAQFDLIEFLPEKKHHNGGQKRVRKIRLKE